MFELADIGHLASILAAVKRVDGVYDADPRTHPEAIDRGNEPTVPAFP